MDKLRAAMEPARKEKHSAVILAAPLPHAGDANSVPRVARRFALDQPALEGRRVVFPTGSTEAARAYKMLRTQLLQRVRQNRYRVIGITSPADGDGKTLTAVNLALSLALEPNQTVLLVDLDLHRPTVGKTLGLEVTRGVEACLTKAVPADQILWRPEGFDRLTIAPALGIGAESSELLAAESTRSLLLELRTRYEDRLILVDLPPVLLTDDVLTIAPILDAVLLVISERRTRREDVLRTTELLAGVPLLGTVLNQTRDVERRVY